MRSSEVQHRLNIWETKLEREQTGLDMSNGGTVDAVREDMEEVVKRQSETEEEDSLWRLPKREQ